MGLAISNYKVTRDMLQEQITRIERIHKEKELIRFTNEQTDRLSLLDRILNIENVYLRIMLSKAE